MDALDHSIDAALQQGKQASAVEPHAVDAHVDAAEQRLTLCLEGGVTLSVPLKSLGLRGDLSEVCVEGGGFDLYFPLADEGIFIPQLIREVLYLETAA